MIVLFLKAVDRHDAKTGDLLAQRVLFPAYTRKDGTPVKAHAQTVNKRIKRIIDVKDTRQYEEGEDDRWYPIPGSGHANTCHRCGRQHEIHATVELDDGSSAVVGTVCMAKDDMALASKVQGLESAAKSLAKMKAEQARYLAKLAQWDATKAVVDAMPQPESVPSVDGKWLFMGDARVRVPDWGEMRERRAVLIDAWKDGKMAELLGVPPYKAMRPIARGDYEKKIAAIADKLDKLKAA